VKIKDQRTELYKRLRVTKNWEEQRGSGGDEYRNKAQEKKREVAHACLKKTRGEGGGKGKPNERDGI